MPVEMEKLRQDVQTLQKDMAQVGVLVERLDVTIEKLTEVSSTVSQLLAVQGSRLEMQEKLQEKLQEIIEKRKSETDDAINKVYLRIERIEDKLQTEFENKQNKMQDDIEQTNTTVLDKIDELRIDIKKQNQITNTRVNSLEKWMWTLVGGGTVLITIIEILVNLNFLN